MSLEKNYNNTKPAAAQMFNQNGPSQSPALFGTLQRGFSVSEILVIFLKTSLASQSKVIETNSSFKQLK